MDDFYKKLRGVVNEVSEKEPKNADWESFQRYRRVKDAPKSSPFPWLVSGIVGLLTLLLASNLYWFTELRDQSERPLSNTIHDTIYVTKVIEKKDVQLMASIEKIETELNDHKEKLAEQWTKYRQLQSLYVSQGTTLASLQTQFTSQGIQLSHLASMTGKETTLAKYDIGSAGKNFESTATATAATKNRKVASIFGLPSGAVAKLEYLRPAIVHPSNIIWIRNTRPTNLLSAITPKSLSLSVTGGMQSQLGGALHQQGGTVANLGVYTSFSRQMRGFVGLSLYKASSELEDDASYPNVPQVDVPEGEELKETKVASRALRLHVGLEYMLPTGSRWRPYVGLGYAQSLSNTDEFSFEIEGPQEEYYITPEGAVDQALWRQLTFSLGTDFNLNRRVDFRSAIQYQQSLTSTTPSTVGLSGGLYYHF